MFGPVRMKRSTATRITHCIAPKGLIFSRRGVCCLHWTKPTNSPRVGDYTLAHNRRRRPKQGEGQGGNGCESARATSSWLRGIGTRARASFRPSAVARGVGWDGMGWDGMERKCRACIEECLKKSGSITSALISSSGPVLD